MAKKMTKDQAMAVLSARGLDTRDAAINKLVDLYAAKWGEGERAATKDMLRGYSYGRAINSIAHFDVNAIDDELAAAAKHILTDKDWAELRKGG